jgi:hypothetical protein
MGKHRKKPDRPEPDYSVGYRKPPVEHRFKPGEAKRGRRRATSKSLAQEAKELLQESLTVTEGHVQRRVRAQTFILKKLRSKAANGDLKVASFLFRLAEGADESLEKINAELLTDEDRELLQDYLNRTDSTPPDQADENG